MRGDTLGQNYHLLYRLLGWLLEVVLFTPTCGGVIRSVPYVVWHGTEALVYSDYPREAAAVADPGSEKKRGARGFGVAPKFFW